MESNFFDISELSIQSNKDSWCEHITGGVNLYLWVCKTTGPWVYCVFACVCVCVSVCDIKLEYQQKTTLCARPQ